MAKVYKTIVTTTVLSDTPIDDIDSLSSLAYEMDQGDVIGQWEVGPSTLVEPEQVEQELLAIGNDGTFFEEI